MWAVSASPPGGVDHLLTRWRDPPSPISTVALYTARIAGRSGNIPLSSASFLSWGVSPPVIPIFARSISSKAESPRKAVNGRYGDSWNSVLPQFRAIPM